MGKLGEARAAVDEVMRVEPDYTIGGIAWPTEVFKKANDDQHYIDNLQKATRVGANSQGAALGSKKLLGAVFVPSQLVSSTRMNGLAMTLASFKIWLLRRHSGAWRGAYSAGLEPDPIQPTLSPPVAFSDVALHHIRRFLANVRLNAVARQLLGSPRWSHSWRATSGR
jgi:hypothetical protein